MVEMFELFCFAASDTSSVCLLFLCVSMSQMLFLRKLDAIGLANIIVQIYILSILIKQFGCYLHYEICLFLLSFRNMFNLNRRYFPCFVFPFCHYWQTTATHMLAKCHTKPANPKRFAFVPTAIRLPHAALVKQLHRVHAWYTEYDRMM